MGLYSLQHRGEHSECTLRVVTQTRVGPLQALAVCTSLYVRGGMELAHENRTSLDIKRITRERSRKSLVAKRLTTFKNWRQVKTTPVSKPSRMTFEAYAEANGFTDQQRAELEELLTIVRANGLQIPATHILTETKLDNGSFGVVVKATLGDKPVALKRFCQVGNIVPIIPLLLSHLLPATDLFRVPST